MNHPEYANRINNWTKWRTTYESGQLFIDAYLKQFSKREDPVDFALRKSITYCPAFAKSAVNEIKNALSQRMVDIVRSGGSPSYNSAVLGESGGVDRLGGTMTSFMAKYVLPELLVMAKVGVFVDMPNFDSVRTLADKPASPYLYIYKAEDISNWAYNEEGELINVLLRDEYYTYDANTGLPISCKERYRHFWKVDNDVYYTFNEQSVMVAQPDGITYVEPKDVYKLAISSIPFVILEIPDSLLNDVADYQIALMNASSSDINFILKSNFPFYTEQFDERERPKHLQEIDGTTKSKEEVQVGNVQGRRYPLSAERPGFIHPSPEPLKASMEKQEVLKKEIRQLVHLAVANLSTSAASGESKKQDNLSLEAGLANIGYVLEVAERIIGMIWNMYERSNNEVKISYPEDYSLQDDQSRIDKATAISGMAEKVPSLTFKKEIAKNVATIMLGSKVDRGTLDKILSEIEKSDVFVNDPRIVTQFVESGILDLAGSEIALAMPKGTTDKAKKDHAERLARIAEAQSAKTPIAETDPNPKQSNAAEKTISQDATLNRDNRQTTRGAAKP